ncbi:MAG: hypothetical protein IPJ65_36765 [Archangiaceae bacterium]|nr:hypothetical protein [Archangiaceae bacterium]
MPPSTGKYRERFAEVPAADLGSPCDEVEGRQYDALRPIIVLVPGAGGEGPEMDAAVARVVAWGPSSLYMFRWVGTERRDEIATRLARGLSRIAACVPHSQGRIIVVGHSAGGVLASYAAAQVVLPDDSGPTPWVEVLTVSSMLAGNVPRGSGDEDQSQINFMFDLGARITHYPTPAPGVRVVHLRTHAPADMAMTPLFGHKPNNPTVGVPGAPQIDLPPRLDHGGSLQYVLRAVMEGRAGDWLRAPATGTAAAGR